MIRAYTVNVSLVETYPANPQVSIPFVSRSTSVLSRHPSAIVYFSLDGIVDAGVIDSARTAGLDFGTPTQAIWIRREAGEVSPEDVLVDVSAEDVIY
jgi:hypothetical protein